MFTKKWTETLKLVNIVRMMSVEEPDHLKENFYRWSLLSYDKQGKYLVLRSILNISLFRNLKYIFPPSSPYSLLFRASSDLL